MPAFHLIFVHVHKEEGEKERARGREGEREEHSSIINAGVDYFHRGEEFKLV